MGLKTTAPNPNQNQSNEETEVAIEIVKKACTKCKEVKKLESFNKAARAKDGRKSQCRKCTNEAYKYLNSEEYMRWTGLWQRYGITVEEFDGLVEKQQGLCAICGQPPNGKRLCVDHCHETGRIRGLLCTQCNHGLGMFKDSTAYLATAIQYLESVTGEHRPTYGRYSYITPPHKRNRQGAENFVHLHKVGDEHPMAIFTEDQIREFRRRYDAKEITSTDLAKEQGVPKTTMQAITSRRNWKHID